MWQQTSSPVTSGGEPVPVLDPSLWSGALPWLLLVLAGQAVVAVLAHRHGSWSRGLAVANIALDLAFAVPVLLLVNTGSLFNPAFVDVLVEGGWADAERDLNLSTAIGVVVVLVWSVVETLRNLRRAGARRSRRRRRSGVERADDIAKHLRVPVTSARVVSGHISAMLWKGVIKMPRLHIARCM